MDSFFLYFIRNFSFNSWSLLINILISRPGYEYEELPDLSEN